MEDEYDDQICHCGEPIVVHYDGFTRHLCDYCDSVRCDTWDGYCGR